MMLFFPQNSAKHRNSFYYWNST